MRKIVLSRWLPDFFDLAGDHFLFREFLGASALHEALSEIFSLAKYSLDIVTSLTHPGLVGFGPTRGWTFAL